MNNNVDQSLPGSNPCTWSPGYWCVNTKNMAQCGLTEEDCAEYKDPPSA